MDGFAQPSDHRRRQKGRRAAAEMHLGDAAGGIQERLDQRQFFFQIVEINGGGIALEGDDRRAAAEPAEGFTERQVKIERKRTPGVLVVPADGFREHGRWYGLDELRRSGVGGVSRSRNVVFPDEREIELGRGRRRSGDGTWCDHGKGLTGG